MEGSGIIQRNKDVLCSFTAEGFQLALAYLVDIFEALNLFNRHLQGKNTSRIDQYDTIRAFVEKLGLWFRRVNVTSRHSLT